MTSESHAGDPRHSDPRRILIRPIRPQDVDALVQLGARMHSESAFSFLPYDVEKVRRIASNYTGTSEDFCGFAAKSGGDVVGMLLGYVSEYFFCREKVASDVLVFVDRPYRGSTAAVRMIRAFRAWAIDKGAKELCLGVSTQINVKRAGQFYERLGLDFCGGVYKERL